MLHLQSARQSSASSVMWNVNNEIYWKLFFIQIHSLDESRLKQMLVYVLDILLYVSYFE